MTKVLGVSFKYLDVEKNEFVRKLYEEVMNHGYEGVPQIYFVCKGEPYFIAHDLPIKFENR